MRAPFSDLLTATLPTSPLSAKISIWRCVLILVIVGYLLLCMYLFFAFAEPSLLGRNQLRIGADSSSYLLAAGLLGNTEPEKSLVELVGFTNNYLGPVLIAKMIPSLAGIALFNCALFVVGLWIADTLPGVRLGPFFFLMIVNPLTTPSILTVNKEILSFFAIILFLKYISPSRRSRWMLLVVLVVSLLARWEQALLTGAFLALEHRWSPLRGRHILALFLLIGTIAAVYPVVVKTGIVDIASMLGIAEGGKFMPVLSDIQAKGGFPLVVGPKIMLNLFGQLLNPSYFWTDWLRSDFSDIQNTIAIPFHCVAMFAVVIAAIVKRRLNPSKASVYWMLLYLVVSASAPLFQPRYQFAIYALLSLEVCGLTLPLNLRGSHFVYDRFAGEHRQLGCRQL